MITLKELTSNEFKSKVKYKVSICVTCYNEEKYIKDALEGLLAQKTNFPFLIVIGDDCSTDKSREILTDYQNRYKDKIKVLFHKENKGLFANRKEIFKHCDSEYIAFCDGDDYWIDSECLQHKVDFLDNHPEYMGYQTGGYIEKGNSITDINELEEHNCFFDFGRQQALHNEYPGQVGGFFFRNIYACMNEEYFEKYTGYKVEDSGKLPIVAGIIGDIYRQDKKTTFVYRVHESSRGRNFEKQNRCKQLFLSHLIYVDMVKELFGGELEMQIDNQLSVLVVNSYITAVKSLLNESRKENWNQFFFLYNYGYFTKKQIRRFIYVHIVNKLREKLK